MRSKDIKLGGVYEGRKERGSVLVQRHVTEIGPGLRGIPAPGAVQVVFEDVDRGSQEGYRYLDTFAKWAQREVKP
jgi:hypothetical protein